MPSSPLLNSDGLVRVTILSAGAAIADTIQIASIEVTHSLNRIPSARLVLLDGDMPSGEFPVSDADTFKPGSAITVQAGYGNELTTVFEGIVIKHAVKIDGHNESRLVVECRDKALAMTVGRKNANFVDSTDSDIIGKLIGAYSGLTADVAASDTTYKELVQYYCSDWDFMLARAEVNGLLVAVEAGKISVQAPQAEAEAVLSLTYGLDMLDFQAEMDSTLQLQSVAGISWDPATQAIQQQQAAPQALTGQGNLAAADLAGVLGVASFTLQSGIPLDAGALGAWTKAQQTKSELSRIRGRVRFQGSALAKVGSLLELKNVGARFNGKVLISSVTHTIVNGNWLTEAEFGFAARWFAEQHDLAAPAASGVTAGVGGLQIGVVMKLDADPESQYKIKVSVPVMQAETDGVWARLASFHASDGFGAFFVPEIGDEVILGFFNDDPSHPVILGSLYSSKRKPAYELSADNFTKAVVTRSKLKLEFDDDKKIVTIVTPARNTLVISDDGKSILLQDQNQNKVELSSGGIVLDSPKDIAISAKGKVTIDAVGTIELTAKADLKQAGLNIAHNAQIGFTAKGAASAELSASGQTTVKGAMVMIN